MKDIREASLQDVVSTFTKPSCMRMVACSAFEANVASGSNYKAFRLLCCSCAQRSCTLQQPSDSFSKQLRMSSGVLASSIEIHMDRTIDAEI